MIPGQQQQFKIPRQLERRPPRPVRRRAGTLGCGVIGGRFIAVVFLGVAIFLLARIPIVYAVVTHGESHPGTVLKTWTSRGKRSTSYHVQFSYDAGGQIHTDSRPVSHAQYDQLSTAPPSLPMDVRALSFADTYYDQMYLPGESLWGPVWVAVLVAVVGNGIAGLISYFMWIVPWQHKKLCREGKPIVGQIARMHSTKGKTTTYYLDFEFDHPGLGVRVRTMTVTRERWHQAYVGEPVSVLCYPHRKRPTVIYEYGDFECV